MIDKKKYNQYGEIGLEPKAITIHNTGTRKSAKELLEIMKNGTSSKGCHFLVDKDDIIEVMPINYRVYHTGKGRDWAFNNSIAIEICSQVDSNEYLKGQAKAISLIKKLMRKYNLSTDDIYFHNDFANVYCPCDILNIYGNKRNFLRKEFENV